MSKPDWKDAPEWAQWVAMDKDGTWAWYEDEPNPRSLDWACKRRYKLAPRPKVDNSWLKSLEPRP